MVHFDYSSTTIKLLITLSTSLSSLFFSDQCTTVAVWRRASLSLFSYILLFVLADGSEFTQLSRHNTRKLHVLGQTTDESLGVHLHPIALPSSRIYPTCFNILEKKGGKLPRVWQLNPTKRQFPPEETLHHRVLFWAFGKGCCWKLERFGEKRYNVPVVVCRGSFSDGECLYLISEGRVDSNTISYVLLIDTAVLTSPSLSNSRSSWKHLEGVAFQ